MTSIAFSKKTPAAPKVLVAGFGNMLRHDDAFGVVIAQRLCNERLPAGVVIHEAGIAGLTLVQELFDAYDGLVVIDAVERGGSPGTLYELEASIPDVAALDEDQRFDFFADMHYAEPGRAMALAQALGVLPRSVVVVGCQAGEVEEFGLGFTPAVEAVLDRAVAFALAIITRLAAECATLPVGSRGQTAGRKDVGTA